MRAIWKGSISFGLINIPIKLYSATEESTLNLDMLDGRDFSRIKYKKVNEKTGREVNNENIVKGYLYNDEYVILDNEDFEAADAVRSHIIEILHFVDESEISSVYYEKPYYLEPDKSAEKAYAVLRDALAASGKVGVTMFVLRNKETLAILKPYGKVIVLNRIRFEEEIRDYSDLNLPEVHKAKSREQLMANKLIEQLTEKFDITSYKDTYTASLIRVIKDKAKGKKPKRAKLKVMRTDERDLVSMLKASLDTKKRAS